jgi:uncharacterized membrane protein YagU involved in acid resistance
MDEAIVREAAYAMPLNNPSYPPGPYRFVDREYMIIAYRTDIDALKRVVLMIGHPMDIAAVLGTFTGLGTSAGIVMHLLLGTIGFAVGFLIVGPYLSGPIWLRGVTFMAGVWFLAGFIVMPILGVGLFFGGAREAIASLMGHVVLGAILGAIARLPSRHVLGRFL